MLVILERSRILNHRATRESVGTYNYVPDALQKYENLCFKNKFKGKLFILKNIIWYLISNQIKLIILLNVLFIYN